MKAAIVAASVVALWAASALAAPPTSDQLEQGEDVCARTACRAGGFDVAVGVDATHYTDVPVNRSPFVTPDGEILIFPGETVAVQFTITADALSAPRFLKQYQTPKDLALKVDTGSKLIDDPLNASLPPLPRKDGEIDMAAFPPDTLLISYGQSSGRLGMMMDLRSNLTRTLKLDAEMSLIKKDAYEWHYTSTCPLRPGAGSYENWPSERGPMLLSHFRFLAEGAKTTCE